MKHVKSGQWGLVLDMLSSLTLQKNNNDDDDDDNDNTNTTNNDNNDNNDQSQKILAKVHEMAILELGDIGEMELAFATLKLCRNTLLDDIHDDYDERGSSNLGQSVERKLHALNALRTSITATATATATAASNSNNGMENVNATEIVNDALPTDYYGYGTTKEKRRNEIAKDLGDLIPIIPQSRLVSLLQQSIKWQVHTGTMPMIKEQWNVNDDNDNEKGKEGYKGSKKNRSSCKRKFDLVLGEIDVHEKNRHHHHHDKHSKSSSTATTKTIKLLTEKIPLDPYSVIKFSKKTVVTSALFYNDVNNKKVSLITGSSDGFIEVWDEEFKFTQLRMDLEYQKKEELMCHYNDNKDDDKNDQSISILALTVNSDGTMLASGDSNGSINIWSIQKGLCVRSFDKVHGGAITCLEFSKDGEESSRILSGSQDGTCREFGLRTCRMLKEFQGHTSFINCCNYVLTDKLLIVTGSADGTVRIWDAKTAETLHVLNPLSSPGLSAVVNRTQQDFTATSDVNIHTVLHLHTPSNTMIVIPRESKAYLITYSGVILRTFSNDVSLKKDDEHSSSDREDFVTGAVSPSNKWLYVVTGTGLCICFDVTNGKVEKIIRDFGIESTGGKTCHEISGVTHHPLKGILGAFSSSMSLKRGLFTVWK